MAKKITKCGEVGRLYLKDNTPRKHKHNALCYFAVGINNPFDSPDVSLEAHVVDFPGGHGSTSILSLSIGEAEKLIELLKTSVEASKRIFSNVGM